MGVGSVFLRFCNILGFIVIYYFFILELCVLGVYLVIFSGNIVRLGRF